MYDNVVLGQGYRELHGTVWSNGEVMISKWKPKNSVPVSFHAQRISLHVTLV
jgi:hypothetical protein